MKSVFTNESFEKAQKTSEEFVEEFNEKFFDVVLNLKPKIATFLANPPDIQSTSTKRFERNMRVLFNMLNNPSETNRIAATYKFIAEATNFMQYNKKRMSEQLIPRYNKIIADSGGVDKLSKQKQYELSELGREILKIKDKLYLFNYLKDVQDLFKAEPDLKDNVFEIYNRFKIESSIKSIMDANNLSDKVKETLDEVFSKTYSSTELFKKDTQILLSNLGIRIDEDFFIPSRYKNKVRIVDGKEYDALTFQETIDKSNLSL
jgi:hypothetical protein